MSVKTIFKILIGTYVVIITACLLVEMCNINLYSSFINTYARASIRKGCEYFSSETYRTGRAVVNLNDIKNKNGGTAVSGNIYGTSGEANVWYRLYGSTSWDTWTKSIKKYDGSGSPLTSADSWKNYNMNMYYLCSNDYIGKYYRSSYMTPTNLGIPFIGLSDGSDNSSQSLEQISRWIFAQLLSSGNKETIDGHYVNYHGFKVDLDNFKITSKEYRVFDLSNTTDLKKFQEVTNMRGETLASNAQANAGKYGFTVALTYTVPIEYDGITPFKRMFSWVRTGFSRTVGSDGIYHNRNTQGVGLNNFYYGTVDNGNGEDVSGFSTKDDLSGGGYETNNTDLANQRSSNKIVYYLIH